MDRLKIWKSRINQINKSKSNKLIKLNKFKNKYKLNKFKNKLNKFKNKLNKFKNKLNKFIFNLK